jgi:tRNA G18 (ribose-2'-O)-methylase SpoU
VAQIPDLDLPVDEARALLAPLRTDLSIALDSFGNAFGVGASIRVAHSFLVQSIYLIGTEPFYEKAAMGMHRYEQLIRTANAEAFLEAVQDRPLLVFEKEEATVDLCDVPFAPNAVMVFGSERFGVSDPIRRAATHKVGISMYGINHSFPVVATVGMGLFEWARRNARNADQPWGTAK